MNKNLINYMQRTRFLEKEKCSEVINALNQQNTWREYPYSSPKDNICVSDNPEIPYWDCQMHEQNPLLIELEKRIDKIVDDYISEFLKDMPWFFNWKGKGKFHFICYPAGTGMGTHCDHVSNQFDGSRRGIPILTCLGSLNDEYDGGELKFWEDTSFKLDAGEIIVFPSNFLYPHEVLRVKAGYRYSFVKWIW